MIKSSFSGVEGIAPLRHLYGLPRLERMKWCTSQAISWIVRIALLSGILLRGERTDGPGREDAEVPGVPVWRYVIPVTPRAGRRRHDSAAAERSSMRGCPPWERNLRPLARRCPGGRPGSGGHGERHERPGRAGPRPEGDASRGVPTAGAPDRVHASSVPRPRRRLLAGRESARTASAGTGPHARPRACLISWRRGHTGVDRNAVGRGRGTSGQVTSAGGGVTVHGWRSAGRSAAGPGVGAGPGPGSGPGPGHGSPPGSGQAPAHPVKSLHVRSYQLIKNIPVVIR